MNWRVEFTPRADREMGRLPAKDARRILDFLRDRVSNHPDPRALAKRLSGTKQPVWRFRVGAYRILARFFEDRLVVVVVEVGNRREVYR